MKNVDVIDFAKEQLLKGKENIVVIYSQRVAAKLMLKGFVLQGLGRNKSNKDKNVFYFKDSNAIKQAICEINLK